MNSSKKVERTFRYGPYGENTKSEGTQTIPAPFGYKGGYRMPGGNKGEGNVSNSLYHFGQRYYDPTTGRWTQQDPLNQAGSTTQGDRFLFAGSDPINLADPSGDISEGELIDDGGAAYGCYAVENPVGTFFCGAGIYKADEGEIDSTSEGAAEGLGEEFESDVDGVMSHGVP